MGNLQRVRTVLFMGLASLLILPQSMFLDNLAAHLSFRPAGTTIFSFFDHCCQAYWYGGGPRFGAPSLEALSCPGKGTDRQGFVIPLGKDFTLEDDNPAKRSFETHPMWIEGGFIYGVFKLKSFGVVLQKGDRFVAKVGFLKGAQAGQARFSVWYDEKPAKEGGEVQLAEVKDSYDGKLRSIEVDLSDFAGGDGAIVMRVEALESAGQDWAVWVNPRIERKEAPAATATLIPTFTSTPSPTPELLPTSTPTASVPPISPAGISEGFSFVTEGPVMQEAFEDGDDDGVPNFQDECPNTPASRKDDVFENGCLCQDSDGGVNPLRKGTVTFRSSSGQEETHEDYCSYEPHFHGGKVMLRESYCNANDEPEVWFISCGDTLGPGYQCYNGQCYPVGQAIPELCWSAEGTCADGIQNQGEEGVDCGGRCPPCNTRCTTGTKYAPPDTPCTTYYPTDTHRIDLPWTDSELEYPCQFFEVCHPGLDHVIEEAVECCSIRSFREGMTAEEMQRAEDEEINSIPDPGLCRQARRLTGLTSQSPSCKRCVGLYIIKGLGDYARWMVGYNWLYPEHNVYGDIQASPAEQLINVYQTGICRDYAEAVTTLLRKAGFSQQEVGSECDGGHCYNVVKLPGDRKWYVVDTTNNNIGIILGGLPGGHDYCRYLDQTNTCWDGTLSTGDPCTGSEINNLTATYMCSPGFACNRDLQSVPGWAPTVDRIVGCP